jgi:hypothetical protein
MSLNKNIKKEDTTKGYRDTRKASGHNFNLKGCNKYSTHHPK